MLRIEQLLLDLEEQIVTPERVVLHDGEGVRHVVQLWHRLSLELSDVHEYVVRGEGARRSAATRTAGGKRSAGSGGDQATPGGGRLLMRSRAAWEARNCLRVGQEHGAQKGL